MGTADELAMDVLINALSTLSKEYVCLLVASLHGAGQQLQWAALTMNTWL